MTIKTRKPTGRPSWPLTLVAGGEGAGKSFTAAQAAASPLVGRTYWIGYGEQDPDEYGQLADFDIVMHSGKVKEIVSIVNEIVATSRPKPGELPTLIVVDSGSKYWGQISDNVQAEANRNNKGNTTPDLWNTHKRDWYAVIDALRAHAGPAIITARYEEVAEFANGEATGRKVWSVKAERGLPYDVDAVVHMPRRGITTISKVRSVRMQLAEPMTVPTFTMHELWQMLGLDELEAGDSAYSAPAADDGSADESGRDWFAELKEAKTLAKVRELGSDALAANAGRDVTRAIRLKVSQLSPADKETT